MHDIDTTRLESEPLSLRQEIEASEFEFLDAGELESPLSEVEEMELASELLAVSSEAELDQFLGDVFKKALKGIRKVGSSGARRRAQRSRQESAALCRRRAGQHHSHSRRRDSSRDGFGLRRQQSAQSRA